MKIKKHRKKSLMLQGIAFFSFNGPNTGNNKIAPFFDFAAEKAGFFPIRDHEHRHSGKNFFDIFGFFS